MTDFAQTLSAYMWIVSYYSLHLEQMKLS